MSDLTIQLRTLTVAEVAQIKNAAFERMRAAAAGQETTIKIDDHSILCLCAMVSGLDKPRMHPEQEPSPKPEISEQHMGNGADQHLSARAENGTSKPEPTLKGTRSDLSFSEVLHILKTMPGVAAWRQGWNGKDQRIKLQRPGPHSKMTEPYIFMEIIPFLSPAKRIPWLASQADMLAEDWVWDDM